MAASFRLTPLLYCLMAVHALLVTVGGHYTYADAPLGFWVRDLFDLALSGAITARLLLARVQDRQLEAL
ncbi:MAG: DUF2238 domain-containing protein [Proteobacteria bacterium]|nr:DUF2238 domain-containing protein [Pseudomonadota bacterium]MCH9025971.1 DUF2238 domain-containing protein [Pseudomonadota bacterium]